MTRSLFPRRQLLRGALASAAVLPLLQATPVRGQSQSYPRRLLIVYTPNGTIRSQWCAGGEQSFELGRILTPLEPFRDKLLVVGGLNMPLAAQGFGSEHTRGIGGLLTGRPILEGTFESAGQPNAGWASGISIDQHIAKELMPATAFRSLELGVQVVDAEVRGRISYAGANQPLPPIESPYAAFERVFGGLTANEPATDKTLSRLHRNRQTVLDLVKEELALVQARVGVEDRLKLESHLESIQDIERRLVPTESVPADAGPDSGADSGAGQARCEAPVLGDEIDIAADDQLPRVGRLQMDILASTFACDLTRIATLQWTHAETNHTFPFLGISGAHHKISHAGDQELEEQERLVKINTWYAEQFAYLLEKLASYTEGDGSLLDNTLVLWCNEVAQGNNHSHSDLPFVIAGSCGGQLATGRFVDYAASGAEGRPHNDLLVSLANAMGGDDTTFGDPDHCTGPLTELMV